MTDKLCDKCGEKPVVVIGGRSSKKCRECLSAALKQAHEDAEETIKQLKKGRSLHCTCCPIHNQRYR